LDARFKDALNVRFEDARDTATREDRVPGELYDDAYLEAKLKRVLEQKNAIITLVYRKPAVELGAMLEQLKKWREILRPYLCDTVSLLHGALAAGKNILLEAQLAAMKDLDYGEYPMTTSSNTLAGYGPVGCGIPMRALTHVTAVMKVYMISVGGGAFPTEILDEKEASDLREAKNWDGEGGEWGVTTGRPRRMGWFDCNVARFGVRAQGATEVALTVLDALGYLDEIPVCIAYDLDGQTITNFPPTAQLERCKPIYTKLPGWKSNVRVAKTWADLPAAAKGYVEFIEKQIACPIRYIGNGPDRSELIIHE
jgi:adenylosuccinate synthase